MPKHNEKLIPVSTTRIDPVIVPEHKVTSELTGDLAIDQQAKLVDTRTYREIFETGMAEGTFDKCENPAQVNKAIAAIKGNGKVCVYMVSEVAHAWDKTTTGWVKKSDEWLAANPFTPGIGHARTKSTGYLSTDEVTALEAQLVALLPLRDNPAITPLVTAIEGKLTAHRAAVAMEAISQANTRKRAATLDAIKGILLQGDKESVETFTLTVNMASGEVSAIRAAVDCVKVIE
jgi:hypothetical protein